MITKDIALRLKTREQLYHVTLKNKDGSPYNVRVNGKVKTWKTRPNEFMLPIKRELREFGYITEQNCDEWTIK